MNFDLKHEKLNAISKAHKVSSLYVFRSISRNDFDPSTSDIDFLVVNPEYFDGHSENDEKLRSELEN